MSLLTVGGPGIPPANPATGGFKGAVRTELKTFARPRYPKTVQEEYSVVDGQSQSRSGGYGY